MGLTYAQSFLRSHITSKEEMMILEKSPERAELLAKKTLARYIRMRSYASGKRISLF